MLLHLLYTAAIGTAAGALFKKLRFPAGLMVGALVGVAAFNIITDWAEVPSAVKTAAQIISGTYIGCSISKSDAKALTKIILPAIFMIFSLLLLNIFIGFIIAAVSPLDLETALMAAVPGGVLVFSLIAVLILNLAFNAAEIPGAAKKVAQVANGCYIGSLVSFADILFLPQVIVPMLILLALYTAYCFFNGYLLHRLFKFEIKAAFLISTPAGASDMALIASDIGVHNPQVFVMHIVRLITVMILFPQVVHLLATVIVG